MAIFKGILKKKKNENEHKIQEIESSIDMLPEDVSNLKGNLEDMIKDKKHKLRRAKPSVEESCETVIDAMRQLEELKIEYYAVTTYLTDIQKIDDMMEEDRESLGEAARKIVTSTREKASIQTTGKRIPEVVYKTIATYEEDIIGEAKRMKENEIYLDKIEKDMKYLEGEKTSLHLQKEEVKDRSLYLIKIRNLTIFFVIVLFAIFLFITFTLEIDMTIPVLLTVLLGVLVGAYIIISSQEYKKEGKQIDGKLNRAILLLNKVKIKYINTKNALDYGYEKYHVKNYSELSYLWDQYNKAKEDEKRYTKNSTILEEEKKVLFRILKEYHLDDPGIWAVQAVALIDAKEMVEVRHSLNTRRQKLRESMDYNNQLKEENTKNIKEYLDKLPEEKAKYEPLLRKHGIYL